MHAQAIVFVRPEGSDGVSGGNLYNRQLIDALADIGGFRCEGVKQFVEQEQGPNTYIVDTLNLGEFSQVVRARVPGQRYILLVHHLPSLEPDLSESSQEVLLERSLMKEFDGFIATSAYTADLMRRAGHGERVFVGQPVMPQNLSPVREYVGPARGLMASNLIPRKGVLEFLSALAETVPDNLPYTLDIAGRGDMDEEYSAACYQVVESDQRLADKVVFLGALAYEEMRARFQEANLYVSSSRMETFGIAMQEARHYGLPIFAVDGGNSRAHLCPGETGELLATPRDLGHEVGALFSQSARMRSYFERAQRGRPPSTETWSQLAKRLLETLSVWAKG